MSMTDEKNPTVESSAFGALTPPMRTSREVIKELTEQGALDGLFAQIDSGQLQLTGEGGFVPGLIKAALERGLQVELADHVGYEKGDPEAHLYPNSRNGTSAKTMASQVGDVDLDIPRDRAGTFIPRLVPKPESTGRPVDSGLVCSEKRCEHLRVGGTARVCRSS